MRTQFIERTTTSLHGLFIAVVLDLVVDISGFPVHSVEGPQAAVLKVVEEVVPLRNARGTLRPLGRNSALNNNKYRSISDIVSSVTLT